MRTRPALAALAAGALPLLVSSMLHSVPEDPAAFPKYRVLFLNGLPVLNDTAERWLANGLRGGEHEFLEQPWDAKTSTGAREIGQGDERADDVRFPASHRLTWLLTPLLRQASRSSKHELEHMRLGPDLSFLCFIPPPLDPPQPHPEEESAQTQVDPTQSWSLLQPLEGSCIYVSFHPDL
jgi:protein OS-9